MMVGSRNGFWLCLGLALATLIPTAATAQLVDASDPAKFATTLQGLGYKPQAMTDDSGNTPNFLAEISGINTVFVFGGCKAGKDCSYLMLVSGFNDIANAPPTWLNRMNADYDLVKVWVGDDKIVHVGMPVPLGPDGMPLTTIRFVLDQWVASSSEIAQSALKEKLTK